ncbi:MAG: LLM class flavin-dependent oxidoreductase [Gaiella sp.]
MARRTPVGRLMEIGIQGSGQLTHALPDPGRFRAVAELAEELGYDAVWAGEHLSFHNPILDLGVALSAFATVTRSIRIGAGVVLLPLRHPSLVAKQAASLDYLSGGRLLLGVGVGGEGAKDFEAAGVPLGERGARADESLRALRGLLAGGPASFEGRFYRYADVAIEPASPRPGGPPILVGGRKEASQRRAGRLADGWLPYLVSPGAFARGVEVVRAHALEAGRDPEALTNGVVAFARVEEDGGGARERARRHLTQRYGMVFEPHHVERLCIVGTPEECAERMAAFAAAGAWHLSLNPAAEEHELLDQVRALHAVARAAGGVAA